MSPNIFRAWKRFFVYFILLVSPVGGGIIAVLASICGVCVGAIGSGVSCSLGFASGYFENLLIAVEMGFLFAYSILWLPAGLVLLLFTLYCLGAAIAATLGLSR